MWYVTTSVTVNEHSHQRLRKPFVHRVFPCYMSKLHFRKMMSSDVLAVLFFFSFFPKTLVSEASAEHKKEK